MPLRAGLLKGLSVSRLAEWGNRVMKSKTRHPEIVHPFLAPRSERRGPARQDDLQSIEIVGLRELELPLRTADVPREARGPRRIGVEDTADAYRVTSRYLCRVPVANDVKRCRCGGVYSERLDGADFCRSCGRD
jgi:hypothetical protein